MGTAGGCVVVIVHVVIVGPVRVRDRIATTRKDTHGAQQSYPILYRIGDGLAAVNDNGRSRLRQVTMQEKAR